MNLSMKILRGVGERARGQRWGFDDWDDLPVWVLLDCSQLSIFLWFYLIFEHADRIVRELDARAIQRTSRNT